VRSSLLPQLERGAARQPPAGSSLAALAAARRRRQQREEAGRRSPGGSSGRDVAAGDPTLQSAMKSPLAASRQLPQGTLAGLVSGLCADVDSLQGQLRASRVRAGKPGGQARASESIDDGDALGRGGDAEGRSRSRRAVCAREWTRQQAGCGGATEGWPSSCR
jgi:hypothetical protein